MKRSIPLTFEGKGASIHAIFYRASGSGPLPTVILCHGFPGGAGDMFGLGERLMKEGFNALAFNYRGTWSSGGLFTIANSLEDVISAMHYLKSCSTLPKFNVDPSGIAVLGWSYGGGMALLGSLSETEVRRVVYIAGGNLSEVARMMKQSDEFNQAILKMVDQSITKSGFRSLPAKELFADIFEHMDKYDLVKQAEELSSKDILMIGGWRDQENTIEHHILPLYRALQRHQAKRVQIEIFDTDNSFTDARRQLADKIISWLKRTHKNKDD